MRPTRTLIASLLLLLAYDLLAAEYRSGAEQQSRLSLTVYHAGRALVREQRKLDLPPGSTRVALMDVPQKILPQTLTIDGLSVREQNYDFDLLSPQTLLQKHVGRSVRIARRSRDSGETLEWKKARILAVNGGVILRMEDGSIETLDADSRYRIVYDEVPDNLRERPTLTLKLEQPAEGRKAVRLSYLTTGLGWSSDYVLELARDGRQASLVNWITIDNRSGIAFDQAEIQLLAGDLNLVNRPSPRRAEKVMMAMADSAEPARESIGGFHLYSLPWKTDLKQNQKKQLKLFGRQQIPVQRLLRDRAWLGGYSSRPGKTKPELLLRFANREPALGLPLPAGVVRVYGQDSKGNAQFLGEDRIGHTAVNDELELRLGKSFDVTVERRITDHRQISKKQYRITREIVINNGSENAQQLKLTDILPSRDWSVLSSTEQWIKRSPEELGFDLTLAPKTRKRIEYRMEIRQP